MQERAQQRCRLRLEGGGAGVGLAEGGGIFDIAHDAVQHPEGERLAAAVGRGGGGEAELGHGLDGKVPPWAGEPGIASVLEGAPCGVEVRVRGRLLVLVGKMVDGHVAWVREGCGGRDGLGYAAALVAGLCELGG
jgi:hypothetical protein